MIGRRMVNGRWRRSQSELESATVFQPATTEPALILDPQRACSMRAMAWARLITCIWLKRAWMNPSSAASSR